MSKKVKNTDYLCLSAMLRAREARMLGRDKLERLLTESYADAARALTDCGYEDMAEMDTRGINEALGRHRAEEIAEVYDMCPDKRVVDVFRLKYEYHNAKVVVKSGGAGGEELLSGSGRSDTQELLAAYESGEGSDLSEKLTEAMAEAKVTLARTGNPQLADFILDRAYFAELTELAQEIGDGFISEYVKVLIDSANVRIAVRAQSIEGGARQFATALISGGTVDEEEIRRSMENRDALVQLYANTMFAEAVQQEGMTAFELCADNAVNAFLADSELVSFGPAAIAGYLAAVENEITAIRIILTGRLTGIDPKLLRERLRESYV